MDPSITPVTFRGPGLNTTERVLIKGTLRLPRRSYLPSRIVFKRGTTDGLMEVAGDSIQLFLSVYINPVDFDFQHATYGSPLTQSLRNRLDSKTRFSLFCEVSGTVDKPEMRVESSIDKSIADVIQPHILERIASKKSEFQERMGEICEARREQTRQFITSHEREIRSQLSMHERALDEANKSLRARVRTDESRRNK
jgi:hypothetical protein